MEKRNYGEYTTLETRGDAHESVNKKIRYSQIIECFKEKGMLSAKECAVLMHKKGYIPTSERNFSAPRITEMCQNGILEPIGKETCRYTGKKVTVFKLIE